MLMRTLTLVNVHDFGVKTFVIAALVMERPRKTALRVLAHTFWIHAATRLVLD
jgi:hypothetical protein